MKLKTSHLLMMPLLLATVGPMLVQAESVNTNKLKNKEVIQMQTISLDFLEGSDMDLSKIEVKVVAPEGIQENKTTSRSSPDDQSVKATARSAESTVENSEVEETVAPVIETASEPTPIATDELADTSAIESIEASEPVSYGDGSAIVAAALSLVGATNYNCYQVVDYALKSAGWQGDYSSGTEVSLDSLLPGDIIVYPSHYSVYVGDGQAVHGGYKGFNVILGDIVVGKTPYTAYRCF